MISSNIIDPEIRLNEIKNLIKLSSSCFGKVFGEFVRNVIVPKDARCDYLNVWFRSENDADTFIFKAKINFNFLELDKNFFILYYEGHGIIYVKLFISNFFPVDDFDINCLTYYYEDNDFYIGKEILTIKLDLLIESVKNKKMLMFYSYGKNMNENKIKKINEMYLSKGWQIRYNGRTFPSELTAKWITNC
jgi:hypothetical protein